MTNRERNAFVLLGLSVLAASGIMMSMSCGELPRRSPQRRVQADHTPVNSQIPLVVNGLVVEMHESWKPTRRETQAIVETAIKELGEYGYDRKAPLHVEEEDLFYTVTFPEPPHGDPAELVCCADFAAKVRIDKKTRLVVDVICGG